MNIHPAATEDLSAIQTVVATAFEESVDGRVVSMMRALDWSGSTRASLVAVEEGAVVGHVQLSRSWIDARRALVDVLVLSPLSVSPHHQRRGIGGHLIQSAVTEAKRQGSPAVFLEGDWNYYGKRGFHAAGPLGFTRPSPRIPEAAFQVVLLPAFEPWMVGPLVYAEAFWASDCVGLRDPVLAQVEERASATDRHQGRDVSRVGSAAAPENRHAGEL